MDMFPSAAAAAAAASDDGKMVDLTDKIEKSGCYARNEASGFPMSNLFIGDSRLGCKSDTDEQLIIHIEFQEFVKVTSKMDTSCAVTCFLLYRLLSSQRRRGHTMRVMDETNACVCCPLLL